MPTPRAASGFFRVRALSLATLGLLAHGFAAPHASAQSFTQLSSLGGGYGTFGMGVSADGTMAIGYGGTVVSTTRTGKWLGASPTAYATFNPVSGYQSCTGTAISADGSIAVGTSLLSPASGAPTRATRWVGSTVQDLGLLPNGHGSYAWGISGDGSVVVGNCLLQTMEQVAYRWSAATGMVPMGTYNGLIVNSALDASYDGSVIVGSLPSTPHAYRWTQEGGFQDLGVITAGGSSGAWGISSDGSVVVGRASMPGNQQHAMRWTSDLGMQSLGVLPSGTSATAADTNADGSVIVGSCFVTGQGNRAFVWTPGTGMFDLTTYLAERIAGMEGWVLSNAEGVSDDGSTVVGWGTRNGVVHGYRVTGLSFTNPCSACAADFDANGGVDGSDLSSFFAEYESGASCADVDQNGGVDGTDLAVFIAAYEAGGC